MKILLTCYGGRKCEALLRYWWQRRCASGSTLPVEVVTNEPHPEIDFCPVIRVDTSKYGAVVEAGRVFDIHGAIICEAQRVTEGPCLVYDIDAVFVRNPDTDILELPDVPMMMGNDYVAHWIDWNGRHFAERNGGALLFGAGRDREQVVRNYFSAYSFLLGTGKCDPWIEQSAWTICNEMLGGATLPAPLNWIYRWGVDDPRCKVLHYHGNGKWKFFGLPEPEGYADTYATLVKCPECGRPSYHSTRGFCRACGCNFNGVEKAEMLKQHGC